MLVFGVLYPAFWDLNQLCKLGIKEYLSDMSNYLDMIYIFGSISNVLL